MAVAVDVKDYVPYGYRGKKLNEPEFEIPAEEPGVEPDVIRTKYWELPVHSLQGWRPFSVVIDYRKFLGPQITGGYGKGFSLHKDLLGGIHGARGSGKDEIMTFLLGKKMRTGKPVWTNYPISFFVHEADGSLTYYESMPLDLDRFYAFSPVVRNGAVGVSEMQYYVEARTSGKEQNRVATYQIMQLRKTALSFLYNVQDRRWVDKRFNWSNDFDLECSDVAKMNYDESSLAWVPKKAIDKHNCLREGAFIHFTFEDTSGFATGIPFSKSGVTHGPWQFDAHEFWGDDEGSGMYPTHFIIDAYEAANGLKRKSEKQEAKDLMANSLEAAIDNFIRQGIGEVKAKDLWAEAEGIAGQELNHKICGTQLTEWGITKRRVGSKAEWAYNIGELMIEKV